MTTYIANFLNCKVRVILLDHDSPVIPVVDLAKAIGYKRQILHKLINNNRDVLANSCVTLKVTQVSQKRETVCLTREGIIMVLLKVAPSRTKDPYKRATIIRFQKWVANTIVELLKYRAKMAVLCPEEISELLTIDKASMRAAGVRKLSEDRDCSTDTIYRNLRKINGPMKNGPRKGEHKYPEDVEAIAEFKQNNPDAGGTQIKRALPVRYSISRINSILKSV